MDVNVACGDYWRWRRPLSTGYRNRLPAGIVTAFEAEEFIWGGRWYHFDTMHFEYRPEFFRGYCRSPPSEGP